jgi:hypothetical protein
MARILVQTNDRRTVLDEAEVQLADVNDQDQAADLLDRLGRAIVQAERVPRSPGPRGRRPRALVPVSDYRDVGA